MELGTLNRRVIIKAPGATQDDIGQPIATWTTLATVWANIRHLSGLETIKADAEASIVKASIRIRRRTDVNTGMRVYHGAVIYEIKAVLPDEVARDKLDLACERIDGSS